MGFIELISVLRKTGTNAFVTEQKVAGKSQHPAAFPFNKRLTEEQKATQKGTDIACSCAKSKQTPKTRAM